MKPIRGESYSYMECAGRAKAATALWLSTDPRDLRRPALNRSQRIMFDPHDLAHLVQQAGLGIGYYSVHRQPSFPDFKAKEALLAITIYIGVSLILLGTRS